MKNTNAYTTRESWLRAATNELRPYFEKLGYKLPENIKFALAFTCGGDLDGLRANAGIPPLPKINIMRSSSALIWPTRFKS